MRNGSGGSGAPSTRDVVHGTRFASAAGGSAATASSQSAANEQARNVTRSIRNIPRPRFARPAKRRPMVWRRGGRGRVVARAVFRRPGNKSKRSRQIFIDNVRTEITIKPTVRNQQSPERGFHGSTDGSRTD